MKKLLSAATAVAMVASMVVAVTPVAVSAADTTKGFSIKTYDPQNPSAASGKNTITIDKKDIGANGYVIPTAVYYSEGTVNTTDSLLVSLTTDSKDISFKYYDPGLDSYFSEAKSYELGGVSFTTDRYISWAGFCKSARSGYKPAGEYVFGLDSSQSAAKTDNYFLGCSWMNKGVDYAWAGETSDAYPFYVFETKLSSDIKAGTYKVTYCDYNTDASGVNDNPCPMVEGDGSRYTLRAQNGDKQLKTEEFTIVVKDDTTTEPTTTTTQAPVVTQAPVTQSTTVVTQAPVSNGDVNFKFVDDKGNSTVKVESGKSASIPVDVNIEAGTNPISALDVQFKVSSGIKISEILDSANAFSGKTVSTNLAELRANYATLKGDTPLTADNGKSAFMLTVDVPAGTPDGTYTVDFAQCKIFKDNTKFNYTTGVTPLTIIVGEGGEVKDTQTTTVTTTKAPTTVTTVANPNAPVKFAFVDTDGKSSINLKKGESKSIELDVNIEAGTNPISALDVQFKLSDGLKVSEILDSANAFSGKTVSTNLAELRANYATLKGDTPLTADNGKSAFMLTVDVPATLAEGTYTVDFAQCKIFKDNTKFNYETGVTPYTITIGNPGVTPEDKTTPVVTTSATTTKTTSVVTQAPTVGDVNFKFVDDKGSSTVNVTDVSKDVEIPVDVNIEAGTNPISALDVQFKISNGLKVSEILDSANAFSGKTVSTNLSELRANYATLKGDTPLTADNGKSAFMLTVVVPANTPAGTYTVDFAQCKIFKDNTKFNYAVGVTPLTITVGSVTTTAKETVTTTSTSKTTTVTETTPGTTTTVVTPTTGKLDVTMWGDTNCDGTVNVADIVVLNRLLNDPSYIVKNPTTKADVTAQGKVNADVVAPQSKDGKGIDPSTVKLTAADSEAIAMYILEKGSIPTD